MSPSARQVRLVLNVIDLGCFGDDYMMEVSGDSMWIHVVFHDFLYFIHVFSSDTFHLRNQVSAAVPKP